MNQETPLTIEIRAFSNNPDVRSGKAHITVFDVLQWLYYNTDRDLKPLLLLTSQHNHYYIVPIIHKNTIQLKL